MGISLHRLPLVVQRVLFTVMELPEKFFLAALSKRSRQLLKVLFHRQPVELEVSSTTEYKITVNEEVLNWYLVAFYWEPDTIIGKALREIFVLREHRHLDATGLWRESGGLDRISRKMIEFLFELFSNLSISIIWKNNDSIKNSYKLLEVMKRCRGDDHTTTVVTLCLYNQFVNQQGLPLVHCEQVVFYFDLNSNQLTQVAMRCGQEEMYTDHVLSCAIAYLNTYFEQLRLNSDSIETLFGERAVQGLKRMDVKINGEIRNVNVYCQENGKEAAVFHEAIDDREQWVILRTIDE